MSNTIKEYLEKQKYNTASDSTYSHIDEWLEWYQGDVKKFHVYKIFNGVSLKSHKRYRLNMAKRVCEDWANLLLNEKVAIKAGKYSERLEQILKANNFYLRANQLIEMAFALGTGKEFEATVDFDDSIIEDTNSIIDKNIKLVNAGLRSKKAAIMEINKCNEAEAQKELDEIAKDAQITGSDIDWTDIDDDRDDEGDNE